MLLRCSRIGLITLQPRAPMTSAVAIVCARDESLHIRRCLRDLISDGIDVILIDHASSDDTVEKARVFLGRGLLSIERLEWTGAFSLDDQLDLKRRIIEQVPHDWVIHTDADEWLASPEPNQSLLEGIRIADSAGANCVNFDEFVFAPGDGEAFEYEWYSWAMRSYYFFQSTYPQLMRAWKRGAGLVSTTGGHIVEGSSVRLHSVDFILRHYIVLSLAHARSKYLSRKFAEPELARGWHRNRSIITADNLKLPSQEKLKQVSRPGAKNFSKADPMHTHFWEWSEVPSQPGSRSEKVVNPLLEDTY